MPEDEAAGTRLAPAETGEAKKAQMAGEKKSAQGGTRPSRQTPAGSAKKPRRKSSVSGKRRRKKKTASEKKQSPLPVGGPKKAALALPAEEDSLQGMPPQDLGGTTIPASSCEEEVVQALDPDKSKSPGKDGS